MSKAFQDSFPLRRGRVHEVCGPGAAGFAAVACAVAKGDLLWIREDWKTDSLNPAGLSLFFDPCRLLSVAVRDQAEALAVAEEALRDGVVELVVTETSHPLDLRQGRRLQLAARAGNSTGLCLIPQDMGSNAAESRWHAAPIFEPTGEVSTLMRWKITKNKSGTTGAWNVRWHHTARRLDMVSPVAERSGLEGDAG